MTRTNLDSTFFKRFRGSCVKIEVEEDVDLINPGACKGATERNSQVDMNEDLLEELGDSPYEIIKIYRVSSGDVLLRVQGKNGKEKDITKDYFIK